MKVPGAVPVLDRADVYTADDDKFFTFDVDRGLVFFKKELVDLVRKFKFYAVINTFVVRFQLIGCVFFLRPWVQVRICTKCMQDVNGAAAANKKFEHLYNLTPRTRKEKLNRLRGAEKAAGDLFEKIAHQRLLRRARDFALLALEAERHGQVRAARLTVAGWTLFVL